MIENSPSNDRLIGHLAAMPDGGRATDLALLLGVSQPTLSRMLQRLQARGLVAAEGKARSTRYHWLGERTALAELRRRRLHERIAHRLVDEPELLKRARERLVDLSFANPSGRTYHRRWHDLLDGPLPKLLRKMTEDSEQADLLRKESPFTGLVRPEERREVFERLGQLA
ncbi:MAG: MarR family transcriptional regulator [Pseudomonadota bacterium]